MIDTVEQIYRQLEELRQRIERVERRETVRYATKTAWTPVISGVSTAGTGTYSTQTGSYWRIGGLVFARGAVVWTAHTGTGQLTISLPVTPATVNIGAAALYVSSVTFASGWIIGLLSGASSPVGIRLLYTASNAASTAVPIEAAGDIRFSVWYEAA